MRAKKNGGPFETVSAWLTACAFSGVGLFAETEVTLELLGDLPGGEFFSEARGLSADGSVVVGSSASSSGYEAFRWKDGTMTGLGDLPGNYFGSEAFGVSDDGTIVVGASGSSNGREAFRWVNGTMTGLGDFPGVPNVSEARGVSADGTVVVGFGTYSFSGAEPSRWKDGAMTGLGYLPGYFGGWALGVSADGSVIVGKSSSVGGWEAVRWDNGTMEGLGNLTGGDGPSVANGVSIDGEVVVGGSRAGPVSSTSPFVYEAVRWEGSTITGLSDLPGGDFWSEAYGVSGDGTVVVGISDSGDSATDEGLEAVFWTQDRDWEIISLNDFLDSEGVDRDGFVLSKANAISSNGTTIVGTGVHANGKTEAFRVRILELDPLIGGTPIEGLPSWYRSDWFGTYNKTHAQWINHAEHGFVYLYPESTYASVYFFDNAMGTWWWTSQTLYPFIYVFNPPADNVGTDIGAEWVWYFEETKTPRTFGVVTGDHAGEFLYFGP